MYTHSMCISYTLPPPRDGFVFAGHRVRPIVAHKTQYTAHVVSNSDQSRPVCFCRKPSIARYVTQLVRSSQLVLTCAHSARVYLVFARPILQRAY